MSDKPQDPGRTLVEASVECAPVALGVAAGIFLGHMMHRSARRPVAFALGAPARDIDFVEEELGEMYVGHGNQ